MKTTCSEAFIKQALVKLFSHGIRTVRSVAQKLNVSYHTLKYWMKRKTVVKGQHIDGLGKVPQDWRPAEQLATL